MDFENLMKLVEQFNPVQLLATGFMIWIFYNRLNNKIDKLDSSLSTKIDKLDEKVTDIDRRLCRLEGAFASKDCCMIKDDRIIRKAE